MKTSSQRKLKTTLAVAAVATGIAASSFADQVKLDVSMSHPFLKAGKKQTTYLKIGLTGFEIAGNKKRAPVNVAIVIDKSSSMSGDKIVKAKEAALMAVNRLGSDDIVSIIAYDSNVTVLVPATKMTEKETIRKGIERIQAGGMTALFGGVSKGAAEIRKFFDRNKVNRVILLSDGMANVGPNSPGALGELGASLGKEGVSVTTIGLGNGYNEDLMAKLARMSDGNHAFVKHANDLAKIFNYEFGDLLSVVAQEVVVKIDCARGVRPVRVVGRDADISGRRVTTTLNQLISKQEKYILLEVEVPSGREGRAQDVATVSVSYANIDTKTTDKLTSTVAVRYSEDDEKIAKNVDSDVMISAVLQVASENSRKALELRDKGDVAGAKRMIGSNHLYLEKNATEYKSSKLKDYSKSNLRYIDKFEDADWSGNRKSMVEDSISIDLQRSY